MLKAMFSGRTLWVTLLVVAAMAVMARLGVWQLERREQRIARNADLGYYTNFMNLLDGQYDSLVDVLIILVLSVLIHTLKSRVASILLFAYGMFGFLYSLMAVHEATGWLLPLAGAVAIAGSFTAAKEWKTYCARVQIPAPEQSSSSQKD